jgi:hypothetical protein
MTQCVPYCDFEKALNPRRAVWLCAQCGRDFSLEYLFWYEVTKEIENGHTSKNSIGCWKDVPNE